MDPTEADTHIAEARRETRANAQALTKPGDTTPAHQHESGTQAHRGVGPAIRPDGRAPRPLATIRSVASSARRAAVSARRARLVLMVHLDHALRLGTGLARDCRLGAPAASADLLRVSRFTARELALGDASCGAARAWALPPRKPSASRRLRDCSATRRSHEPRAPGSAPDDREYSPPYAEAPALAWLPLSDCGSPSQQRRRRHGGPVAPTAATSPVWISWPHSARTSCLTPELHVAGSAAIRSSPRTIRGASFCPQAAAMRRRQRGCSTANGVVTSGDRRTLSQLVRLRSPLGDRVRYRWRRRRGRRSRPACRGLRRSHRRSGHAHGTAIAGPRLGQSGRAAALDRMEGPIAAGH